MFSSANLSQAMRSICESLHTPVIAVLLFFIACTILLLGSLLAEEFTEHRHLKVKLPALIDAFRACQLLRDIDDAKEKLALCIERGGLLKRQRQALLEITKHEELTDTMREALAAELVEAEQSRYDTVIKLSETVVRLGPVFGLLGTLIPLGPGIIALGQGDTYTLSQSLLTAFDTTVLGLVSAAGATVVSTIRKKWYHRYMSILEALMECVLEVEKRDEIFAKQEIAE